MSQSALALIDDTRILACLVQCERKARADWYLTDRIYEWNDLNLSQQNQLLWLAAIRYNFPEQVREELREEL